MQAKVEIRIRKVGNLYQAVADNIKTIFQDTDIHKVRAYIIKYKDELHTLNDKGSNLTHRPHAVSYSQTLNW